MLHAYEAEVANQAPHETPEAPKPPTPQPTARPLRFITCGSVDDGKSTLIGRLLWDTKAVPSDQAEKIVSGRNGSDALTLPDFARLLDGLQAEREQGITIDVAYRYFSTARRSFIVADTPGHAQYTRNMATGASTADLAVLLVDARSGLLEQTRRHATIAATFGIHQFVLVVNKFDLVDYDRQVFERLSREFEELARSLGVIEVTAIPASALLGLNVVDRGDDAMPWYAGPTLVEALEKATIRSSQTVGFRFPVQRVSRPDESFRGYQGTVAGGSIRPGDSIVVLPSGETANVTSIVTFDLLRNAAVAGDAITLVLDRPLDISRGDMIASFDARPLVGRSFEADLVTLSEKGLAADRRYIAKAGGRRLGVRIFPRSRIDLSSGERRETDSLPLNTIGRAELVFEEDAIFDPYHINRDTGAFILIDHETHQTVAGGMIRRQVSSASSANDRLPDEVVLKMPRVIAEKIIRSKELKEFRDLISLSLAR